MAITGQHCACGKLATHSEGGTKLVCNDCCQYSSSKRTPPDPHIHVCRNIPDGDYFLLDGKAWIEAGLFAVRIQLTDEGIVVDIYPNGDETADPVASCYAFDSDLPQEF